MGSGAAAPSTTYLSVGDVRYSWCLPDGYPDDSRLGSSASTFLWGHFGATRCSCCARGCPFVLSTG